MADDKSEKLRICPLCKSFVGDDAEQCPRCGAELGPEPETPEKEAAEAKEISLKEEMKAALFMCPECGAFLSEKAEKCPVCKAQIVTEGEEEEIEEAPELPEAVETVEDVDAAQKCPLCGTTLSKDATMCSNCSSEFVMKKPRPVKKEIDEFFEEEKAPPERKRPAVAKRKRSTPVPAKVAKKEKIRTKKPAKAPAKPSVRMKKVGLKPERKFELVLYASLMALIVHYLGYQTGVQNITYSAAILYGVLLLVGIVLVFRFKIIEMFPKRFLVLVLGFVVSSLAVLSWYVLAPGLISLIALALGVAIVVVGLVLLRGWKTGVESIHLILVYGILLLFLTSFYAILQSPATVNLQVLIVGFIGTGFVILSFVMTIYKKLTFVPELLIEEVASKDKLGVTKGVPGRVYGNDVPWYSKASALILLDKLDEALECVDIALKLNPKNEVALVIKGNVYSKMGNHMEALRAYNNALKINPRYEVAWNNKGNALSRMKKYTEALRCYEEAIKIVPNYREAWVNKGYILAKLGKYEDAASCAEKVTSITPGAKARTRA